MNQNQYQVQALHTVMLIKKKKQGVLELFENNGDLPKHDIEDRNIRKETEHQKEKDSSHCYRH